MGSKTKYFFEILFEESISVIEKMSTDISDEINKIKRFHAKINNLQIIFEKSPKKRSNLQKCPKISPKKLKSPKKSSNFPKSPKIFQNLPKTVNNPQKKLKSP